MKERDYDFYDAHLDMNRVYEMVKYVASRLSLEEILKMIREITYDMVAPNSKIYNGDYSEINVEQANRFQSQLRDMCDFFAQSIVDKRTFDENYLKNYEYARPYLSTIEDLKNQIIDLQQQLVDNRMNGEE